MSSEMTTAAIMIPSARGLQAESAAVKVAVMAEKQAISIMVVLCTTVFFTVLNTTMFNVTIPDIAREFRITPATVSWVLTSYVAIFGLGAVTYGKIADFYPIKRLIFIALLLFNAGCLLGFSAGSFPLLLAGRMLQAVGGSAMTALGMYVSVRVVPSAMRGRFLGAVAATIACAGGFGPVVGGFIAGHFHWRYLFLLSMITLLSLPFYFRLLPADLRRPGRFDFFGGLLLGGTVVCMLFFLAQALLWALPLSLLFMFGFILRIRSAADPFIMPELLKDRRYRNGLLTLFFSLGTVHGMMFTLPLMLRNLNCLDTRAIGLVIFPAAMTAALLSFFCGRLADRKGSAAVVYIGLVFFLVGYALLVLLAGCQPLLVTIGLLVSYSGFSIVQSSLARTISMILPTNQTGIGMGMYNLVFFLAGGMGAAIASRIIQVFTHGSLASAALVPGAWPYRLVFALFFCMEVCALVIFYRTFPREEYRPAAG